MGKYKPSSSLSYPHKGFSFFFFTIGNDQWTNLCCLYSDKPYSVMKPGQTRLDRDYYKDATAECPEGQTVLSNYGRFQSIYDQNQNKNVHVGDYHVPAKSANTMGKLNFHHMEQNVPCILILMLTFWIRIF